MNKLRDESIEKEFKRIIEMLKGGSIFGESIDMENTKEVVVAAYGFAQVKALEDKIATWKTLFSS